MRSWGNTTYRTASCLLQADSTAARIKIKAFVTGPVPVFMLPLLASELQNPGLI